MSKSKKVVIESSSSSSSEPEISSEVTSETSSSSDSIPVPKKATAPKKAAEKKEPAPKKTSAKKESVPNKTAEKKEPVPKKIVEKKESAPKKTAEKKEPAPKKSAEKKEPAPKKAAEKKESVPKKAPPKKPSDSETEEIGRTFTLDFSSITTKSGKKPSEKALDSLEFKGRNPGVVGKSIFSTKLIPLFGNDDGTGAFSFTISEGDKKFSYDGEKTLKEGVVFEEGKKLLASQYAITFKAQNAKKAE